MKTIKRVQQVCATKPAPSQAKYRNEFALPKGDVHPSCLCIFDRLSQKPVVKIPLSEQDFCLALLEPHKLGSEFQGMETKDWVAQAIREKLQGSKLREAIEEVDSAKNDAFALLHLLRAHSENQAQCRQWDKDFDEQMNAGIGQLVNTTADFLESSVKGLFYALPDEKPVAQ